MKYTFILLIFAFICFSCVKKGNQDNKNIDNSINVGNLNDKPINDKVKSILQQNAIEFNPDFFSQDDNFIILGKIENNNETIIIVYVEHAWGWDNNRMTTRILLFNSCYELLGMYDGSMNEKPELVNKVLVFPVLQEDGNTIDFSLGIPSQVRVDGLIYKYKSIRSSP